MCHHPLMSPGEHGNLEEPYSTYLKNIIKNGIDLVCSGHDHLQSCIQMKIKNKNVIQVINGAGAKPYMKVMNMFIQNILIEKEVVNYYMKIQN